MTFCRESKSTWKNNYLCKKATPIFGRSNSVIKQYDLNDKIVYNNRYQNNSKMDNVEDVNENLPIVQGYFTPNAIKIQSKVTDTRQEEQH